MITQLSFAYHENLHYDEVYKIAMRARVGRKRAFVLVTRRLNASSLPSFSRLDPYIFRRYVNIEFLFMSRFLIVFRITFTAASVGGYYLLNDSNHFNLRDFFF